MDKITKSDSLSVWRKYRDGRVVTRIAVNLYITVYITICIKGGVWEWHLIISELRRILLG